MQKSRCTVAEMSSNFSDPRSDLPDSSVDSDDELLAKYTKDQDEYTEDQDPIVDWYDKMAQAESLAKNTENQDDLDKVYKDLLRHLQQGSYIVCKNSIYGSISY